MWYIAIEGEKARNGERYLLTYISHKTHLQVFKVNRKKAIKFSTKTAAEEMLLHLPVTAGKKEVIYIEN